MKTSEFIPKCLREALAKKNTKSKTMVNAKPLE